MRFVLFAVFLVCFAALSPGGTPYWLPVPTPTNQHLRAVAFTDSLYGWVAGNGGTLMKTTDGGFTWNLLPSGITYDIADVQMLNRNDGMAIAVQVTATAAYTILLFTTDGGDSWRTEYYPIPDEVMNSIALVDAQHCWLAGESSVLAGSNDGGRSWEHAAIDTGSAPAPGDLRRVEFRTPSIGFATGGRFDLTGTIWRTTNGGALWSAQLAAPEPINDVHFIDSLNIIGVTGDYDYGSGLVRTTDGGLHWGYTYLSIWGDARAMSFRTPAEGWVVLGFAGACMVTRDTGWTWQSMFTPETTSVLDLQFVTPRRGIMVGSDGKIFRFDPDATSAGAEDPVPARHRLLPAYPNPFNGSAAIGFEIGERSRVALTVTDITGRTVATLVDGVRESGSYRAVFDAAHLASGVYFTRLLVSGAQAPFVATGKLLLVR
jgi:photosystem II stability/assembly factor-like uncharacterized protein